MKYIKLFETEAEYIAFRDSDAYITPNISFCRDTKTVKFNFVKDTPDTPAIPDTPGVITYNFEINMSYDGLQGSSEGSVSGDYTDLFNVLFEFITNHGVSASPSPYNPIVDDINIINQYTNISINGWKMIECSYIEWYTDEISMTIQNNDGTKQSYATFTPTNMFFYYDGNEF